MTIKIEGLDAIVKKIDSLGRAGVMKTPMRQSVSYIHRTIKKYPAGSKAHRPQPFKSDKSRRWFFWALREGKIEVPYRRGQSPGSEDLQQSWTTTVSADGRRGEVGTNTRYARLVQDASRQTGYHKTTGWRTIQDVAKKEAPKIVAFFKAAYDKAVK